MSRPPPIVVVTIGYGAGLATGLVRFSDPVLVVLVATFLAIASRRFWCWPVFPALAIGILVGTHARANSSLWCSARLPLGVHRFTVRSIDPGEGTGRVMPINAGCTGPVIAHWPRHDALPAGATMRVTARWEPADRPLGKPDGMLLISDVDSVRVHATMVERARSSIAQAARTLFGVQAPLANALIAGWRGELDPELRQDFAAAGAMHLLAISGLHVAVLAGWVLLALRLIRIPGSLAECTAALASVGYAAFLGWPAAATRASAILLLAAFCRWRQRNVRIDAVIAASALLVLVGSPWGVADIGTWLSVVGVTGVISATRWTDRAVGRSTLVRSVSASLGAVIATAPLSAGVFGQVAAIGIALNLIAAPMIVLILPAILGALVLYHLIPALAITMAASANALLAILQAAVHLAAHTPGAARPGATGLSAALPWTAVLIGAAWIIHGRSTAPEAVRRGAWLAMAGVWLTLVPTRRNLADDNLLSLLFVDVGQGDAALIRTPRGHWIAIDAGPIGEGVDAGRRVVAPLLAREGAHRIDLFVLSHAHRDHVGGGAALLDQLPVGLALEPGELFSDSAYDGWLATLASHHTRWRSVRAGTAWTIDSVHFRVLHPPVPWPLEGEDLNEDSVVLEVMYGGFSALFMGDAGFVAESALAGALPRVDLLKVGHHGSRTATSDAFLATVRPQAAIVSVGRNRYGHPAPETVARFAADDIPLWRTDQEGTVAVATDGKTFTVHGARASAAFAVRH